MTPSPLQKLFAKTWLWMAGFYGLAVCLALVVATRKERASGEQLMLVLAGAAVGALVSRTLCGTLWNIRARVNGAPFQRGDCVQILTGLHRGRVARVYEVWGERNQVRVELGEQEKSETKDVFPHLEVFRERAS